MKQHKWLAGLIIVCIVAFFCILLQVLTNGFLAQQDIIVLKAMPAIRNPFLTFISTIIDVVLETWVAVMVSLVIAAVLWLKDSKRDALFFSAVMIVEAALVFVFKQLVQRPRPIDGIIAAFGYSFPSGHASSAAALFGVLLYLALRKKNKALKIIAIIAAVVMPLLTAFTRLYLGVHVLTDVLGGLALGAFVVLVGVLVNERFQKKEKS